jgi:hypothetical protein
VFADARPETFDAASSALRLRPPRGDLGPRYTLTYRLEAPGSDDEIVQELYPYADPRPVTYLAPGQVVNAGGSWFVAHEDLREALVADGLPSDPPGTEAERRWPIPVAIAFCVAAALVTRRGTRRSSSV